MWITWESQPRNCSMAGALGVPFYEFDFPGGRVSRQLRATGATLRVLLRERPAVVFASNPSLVLTLLLLAVRPLLRFRLCSDAHYGGVVAVTGNRMLQRVLDFANRRADYVIVTNGGHADRIRAAGGRPLVCPDPRPTFSNAWDRPPGMDGATKSALFVCSYEVDEPYEAVFEAARTLVERGFTIFASGRYSRVGISPETVPAVRFLGFVDRPTYEAYLQHADVVLDFTTWEDCLVCGAYEAMAAGRPCVLSRTRALSELFTRGTVFTGHEPQDIVDAVLTAYAQREELRKEIPGWLTRHDAAIRDAATAIRTALGLERHP